MNIREQNLKDIEFISGKVIWFLKMDSKGLFEYLNENRGEALYTIPHEERGMIYCGREAYHKFDEIAERFLKTQMDKKLKTNPVELSQELRAEYSRRFAAQFMEVSSKNVERMISSAYKRSSRKFAEITHYIPCSIFLSRSVDQFSIGPVTFYTIGKFKNLFTDEIKNLRSQISKEHFEHFGSKTTEKDSNTLANKLVDGLEDSFFEYDWIAEIKIDECNEKVSYEKALSVTKSALNILKLLFGSYYTSRISTGEDNAHREKAAKLYKPKNKRFNISLSFIPQSNVIGEDWLELLNSDFHRYFHCAGNMLHHLIKFIHPPPLVIRFISSLTWYGDAVSETSSASKVIKFVSAIEGVTGTGIEKDEQGNEFGVTDIVVRRSSLLYSLATRLPIDKSKRKIGDIYEVRSNLVHGSLSPFDDSCVTAAIESEEVSRMVLLSGLDFFDSLKIDDKKWSRRNLRKEFQKLENSC